MSLDGDKYGNLEQQVVEMIRRATKPRPGKRSGAGTNKNAPGVTIQGGGNMFSTGTTHIIIVPMPGSFAAPTPENERIAERWLDLIFRKAGIDPAEAGDPASKGE